MMPFEEGSDIMRARWTVSVMLAAAAVVGTGGPRLGAQARQYAKLAEIHIGGTAGFDYLNVDPDARRLYVSNSTQVVVIDIDKNVVVGKIADTPRVHGIALVPGGRGFTSNGGENMASIVDLKTLQTIKKVDIGPGPDAILYEPKNKEVYGFNHSAGTATVVKADTGDKVATIKLSGAGVETGVADPELGRVFVNIEDTSMIDAIDIATHQVVGTWPVAPAAGPTGLAIDLSTHRLFAGGGPNTVMIDAKSGKVVASMPICNGTDATWFDPGTKLLFSSCGSGEGAMTIARVDGDKLTVVQTLQTVRGARTMAIDYKTHNIYVVGQDYQPADPNAPAPAPGRRGGPPPVPDSFKAIAYGMK